MDEELKILMLEDMPEDAGLIERVLNKEKIHYTYQRVDTRDEFINAIDSFKPNIILSDHSLPQFNSIEALKICREKKFIGPFILVTGAVSEEFAAMCIKQGAYDYVLKSNLARLPVAIRASLSYHEQELTKIKQQEELKEQNQELLKINKELDSFVYSASHNLRSPLTSILGLVNIVKMEDTKDPDMLKQYFTMIEHNVLKLDETIKEIINYSKNARNDVIIKEVNLENIINESFEQLMYLNGFLTIEKSIDVENEYKLFSDAHRLKVIFGNLISNCIKYHDVKKSVKQINVKVNCNKESAQIEVIDNGIGIAQNLIPDVFNMFFRATELSDGAGLGLYIVKEMIEKLKGEISIESKIGEGTVVKIIIPNNFI